MENAAKTAKRKAEMNAAGCDSESEVTVKKQRAEGNADEKKPREKKDEDPRLRSDTAVKRVLEKKVKSEDLEEALEKEYVKQALVPGELCRQRTKGPQNTKSTLALLLINIKPF